MAAALYPDPREQALTGSVTKFRVVPLSERCRALIEHYFILHERIDFSGRTIQRTVKRGANAAMISRPMSPTS